MASTAAAVKKGLLTALFPDGDSAERGYQACIERGYEIGDVNVIVSEGTRKKLVEDESGIKAKLAERKAEGGELGGPKGGRAGILMTVFAAAGAAIAVPALGVVAGPIAVALAAAGAAGAAAGLISSFSDWGVPADRVRGYESAIKKGSILVVVETRDAEDARQIAEDWKKLGARDIFYR